jgi:hypothetical protein
VRSKWAQAPYKYPAERRVASSHLVRAGKLADAGASLTPYLRMIVLQAGTYLVRKASALRTQVRESSRVKCPLSVSVSSG